MSAPMGFTPEQISRFRGIVEFLPEITRLYWQAEVWASAILVLHIQVVFANLSTRVPP